MPQKKILKVPITNVYAKGDYSAEIFIGDNKQAVNLILDTGSSTLVVEPPAYNASSDKALNTTSYAQEVNYGIGGWDGPVVLTTVAIGNDSENEQQLVLEQSHIAIAQNEKGKSTFGDADGILGLAYHHLNKGFDLRQYLTAANISPAVTFPWPFDQASKQQLIDSTDLPSFKHFLWQQPEQDIEPYFTQLETQGLVANKFAFYSHRSSTFVDDENSTTKELSQLSQNQGFIVLGGGEEQTRHYQGDFKNVAISHDIYYNAKLISIQIAQNNAIVAEPLAKKDEKAYLTNAIIDTGASALVLTKPLFTQMVEQLSNINPKFASLIKPFADIQFQATGIDKHLLMLDQWPDIHFNFISESGAPIQLTCPPQCYWQVNYPTPNKAVFKILSQLPQWPNQSIIGLPLLNNYYVIFDRSKDKAGVVKFAEKLNNSVTHIT